MSQNREQLMARFEEATQKRADALKRAEGHHARASALTKEAREKYFAAKTEAEEWSKVLAETGVQQRVQAADQSAREHAEAAAKARSEAEAMKAEVAKIKEELAAELVKVRNGTPTP